MDKTIENFLRYVKIDTQSSEESTTIPSTMKQHDLARQLVSELEAMGAAEITYDKEHCYVYATIPASAGCEKAPVLGFISHMDTSPAVTDTNVNPRIVENYDGKDIVLNAAENIVMKVEDYYEEPFGVRTVRVEGTSFLINGKPFYFKGFGKHEDSAFHGRGMDVCLDVKDVNLIHWLHANSFRTSHYPYAEEMYRLCDREGIVIIDEVPAVGIGAGAGINPYETFPIREHHEQVIKDMIARDKNHPCVVMWSLGNEPDTENFPESAYEYWHSLYELAHETDPSDRPVTLVCCQNNYEKDIVTRSMDVVCINRYYGWYNLSGDLDAACYGLNLELDFWEKQNKPVMITEYGADAVAGIHECVPEMFSEEFQVEFYKRQNAQFDKRKFFIGEHVWNFADFATVQGCMRVDGNKKGLFTRERRPKMAAHYFKERWGEIPNFEYKG